MSIFFKPGTHLSPLIVMDSTVCTTVIYSDNQTTFMLLGAQGR